MASRGARGPCRRTCADGCRRGAASPGRLPGAAGGREGREGDDRPPGQRASHEARPALPARPFSGRGAPSGRASSTSSPCRSPRRPPAIPSSMTPVRRGRGRTAGHGRLAPRRGGPGLLRSTRSRRHGPGAPVAAHARGDRHARRGRRPRRCGQRLLSSLSEVAT